MRKIEGYSNPRPEQWPLLKTGTVDESSDYFFMNCIARET